ncbi:MAG: NADH-quinone oxidoreductase subunit NuoE [Alphaproteobacteria bacterium]|nr:NADH-quinone oxidoreductase subunit NuoE [Alphaproteobacteria bacterium]
MSVVEGSLQDYISERVDAHGRERIYLIPILHDIQERFRHISEEAMKIVANELGIFPSEVYGVVTFYSFLDTKKKGKYIIRLCKTISCMMKGSKTIAEELEKELGIEFGETTEDDMFTLEWANCIGLCDRAPAMLVNDEAYSELTPTKIKAILEECRRGPRAQRTSVYVTDKKGQQS